MSFSESAHHIYRELEQQKNRINKKINARYVEPQVIDCDQGMASIDGFLKKYRYYSGIISIELI